MMKKWLLVVIIIVVLISLFHFVTNRNQREINMSDKDIAIQWNRDNYPVEITNMDSKGEADAQIYEKPPKKVIAVWQNSIETLLALGVGDRIEAGMGVPDRKYISLPYQSDYDAIPYKSLENLDLETMCMMDPDLIVGWYSTFSAKVLRSTDFWNKRGIHSYIALNSCPLTKERTIDNEFKDILNMGRIFDRQTQAENIVKKMKANIEKAKSFAEKKGRKPRALIMEFQGANVVVYGRKTLAGNILQNMQGELLAADEITISREQLIAMDPDVIFLIVIEDDYDHPEYKLNLLYKDKALQNVRCVREHKVEILPLYSVYSSGTRTLEGIERIGKGLYPEWEMNDEDVNSKT